LNILIFGDIVGKAGRKAVFDHLPTLREKLKIDFVVANGENAAHGFGITEQICASMYELGVDVITTGNHIWDQREIMNYIDNDPRLLRPLNFPKGTPGAGLGVYFSAKGKRVLVLNLMGCLFMDSLDDPFAKVQESLKDFDLGVDVDAIIVDFHGEASSEKQAMGCILDGLVTVIIGTHTHVPTADHQVLPKGSAYQTDIGMTGDYNSVIGMKKEVAVERFMTKVSKGRLEPAEGPATLCGVFVETDDLTGLANKISPLRIGGSLSQVLPA